MGKADALMARHRAPQATAGQDGEFPVLDEVVQLPSGSGDPAMRSGFAQPASADAEQIKALAATIHASLLARLQPEIDALIEKRLSAGLPPLVERVTLELRDELQLIARNILGDAIHAAVDREFDRRK